MNSTTLAASRDQLVLLVEDEPGLQEAIALALEIEGFDVVRASNGREALVHLATSQPDLIVTDYMMPSMNGAEMINEIRSDGALARVPILLISASLPKYVDKKIADAFLPKPIGVSQLVNTIEELLDEAVH